MSRDISIFREIARSRVVCFPRWSILQAAINRYLAEHNRCSTPFIWTADPERSSPPQIAGTIH